MQTEELQALQEKVRSMTTWKRIVKESERKSRVSYCMHLFTLHVLVSQYTALEQQGAAVKEKLEKRVVELEKKLEERETSGDTSADTAAEVRRQIHT